MVYFHSLCISGVPGAAPVTRSSVDVPRGGVSWGPPSESGVVGGLPATGEGVGGGPGASPRSRQVLLEALLRIRKKDKKQYFAVEVDPKLVPDYYVVVSNPMHFDAMRQKVEEGLYQGKQSPPGFGVSSPG